MRGIRVDDVVSQCKVPEPFIVTARAELNVEGVSDDIARLEVTLARDAALRRKAEEQRRQINITLEEMRLTLEREELKVATLTTDRDEIKAAQINERAVMETAQSTLRKERDELLASSSRPKAELASFHTALMSSQAIAAALRSENEQLRTGTPPPRAKAAIASPSAAAATKKELFIPMETTTSETKGLPCTPGRRMSRRSSPLGRRPSQVSIEAAGVAEHEARVCRGNAARAPMPAAGETKASPGASNEEAAAQQLRHAQAIESEAAEKSDAAEMAAANPAVERAVGDERAAASEAAAVKTAAAAAVAERAAAEERAAEERAAAEASAAETVAAGKEAAVERAAAARQAATSERVAAEKVVAEKAVCEPELAPAPEPTPARVQSVRVHTHDGSVGPSPGPPMLPEPAPARVKPVRVMSVRVHTHNGSVGPAPGPPTLPEPAARTPTPKHKLRAKHSENREAFTVSVGPGRLGIALTLDPGTCMAVVQNDAAPAGQVDIGAPGRVKAGDRLDALNGKNFGLITSFDQDGDGQIEASELVDALETSDLRESWIARVGVDVAAHQTNAEMADAIIAEFDAEGDGTLSGDEISAFFHMMLQAHLAQIIASPRPMTLTFSRPKPAGALLIQETIAVKPGSEKVVVVVEATDGETGLRSLAGRLFRALDADGDGLLSTEEASKLYDTDDWDDIISGADENGDGLINELEWVDYVVAIGREEGVDDAIESFNEMLNSILPFTVKDKAGMMPATDAAEASVTAAKPARVPRVLSVRIHTHDGSVGPAPGPPKLQEPAPVLVAVEQEPAVVRTPTPKHKLRAKHSENREAFTVSVGPGRLGIALTLDPGTCMAVVQNDAAPAGQVDIGAPGRVKAGDRLDATER